MRYASYPLDLPRLDKIKGLRLLDDGTKELNFASAFRC